MALAEVGTAGGLSYKGVASTPANAKWHNLVTVMISFNVHFSLAKGVKAAEALQIFLSGKGL